MNPTRTFLEVIEISCNVLRQSANCCLISLKYLEHVIFLELSDKESLIPFRLIKSDIFEQYNKLVAFITTVMTRMDQVITSVSEPSHVIP